MRREKTNWYCSKNEFGLKFPSVGFVDLGLGISAERNAFMYECVYINMCLRVSICMGSRICPSI